MNQTCLLFIISLFKNKNIFVTRSSSRKEMDIIKTPDPANSILLQHEMNMVPPWTGGTIKSGTAAGL